MENEIELAIEAEKEFCKRNFLLVTFTENEIYTNIIRHIHESVENVFSLEPELFLKRRFVVEVKDSVDIYTVKDVIEKYPFANKEVQVKLIEKFADSFTNLDPYTLEVCNIPSDITPRDLKLLFPLSKNYTFPLENSEYKTALVHFEKITDAVETFKTTNFIQFQSNFLTIKFHRNISETLTESSTNGNDKTATKDTEDISTDYICINSDSEDDNLEGKNLDDITKWDDIRKKSLLNKRISDSLIIKNLPLNTTEEEIQKLFPSLHSFQFLNEKESKTCIVKFKKHEDCIEMYTESSNVYKSNVLQIDFYCKENDSNLSNVANEIRNKNGTEDIFYTGTEKRNVEVKQKKKKKEDSVFDNILSVQNLPPTTSFEDIHELFPRQEKIELFEDNHKNSCSAYVTFKNNKEAIKSLNSARKLYRNKFLIIKFKTIYSNNNLNSFSFNKKRKYGFQYNIPTKKKNVNKAISEINLLNDDEIVIVEDTAGNIVNEDDIECNSEEEEEFNEDEIGQICIDSEKEEEIDLNFDEDDIEINGNNSSEVAVVSLNNTNVLPLDEDDF